MNFFESFKELYIINKGYISTLKGLGNTFIIAFSALAIGLILGMLVASVKVTPKKGAVSKVLHAIADVYITIFRGTPIVVQLLLVYYVIFAASPIPALIVAIVVFGLNSGAYLAEAIRGGILAVDKGQLEAARSLGLSYPKSMFKIVLPQAIKNIIPALGNEFIALLKETSVAGFITVLDVTRATQLIVGNNFDPFVPYIVLAIIYLVIVIIATFFIRLIERRLRAGDNR